MFIFTNRYQTLFNSVTATCIAINEFMIYRCAHILLKITGKGFPTIIVCRIIMLNL